jgi:hypothetical protein
VYGGARDMVGVCVLYKRGSRDCRPGVFIYY